VTAQVVEQHRRLYATVEPIVADALAAAGSEPADDGGRRRRSRRRARRDPELVTGFVVGLLRAASEALERGVPITNVARELELAAVGIIEAGSRSPRRS
jgi:hypothetical protein